MSEWISVKKKLPKKNIPVIVTTGKDTCIHKKQSCFTMKASPGDDLYCCSQNSCDIDVEGCAITHWMPLPEPPNE